MSKYVRTTEGVFELKDNMSISYAVYYCFGELTKIEKEHLFRNDKSLGEVVKQADTVEELIDEYVWDKSIIKFRDKTHFSYERDDFIFELDESILKEGIYGAIWIDDSGMPVLKSVSKMNDEGDLKL